MYMLSKHLRCPSLHRESKHLGILEAAAQAMAESLREGQDIRIIKVKSHIGIKGNEEADRLAHDACVRMNCHQQVLEGLPVREHIHWPVQAQPRIGSSLAGQAQPCLIPQRIPLNCLLEAHLSWPQDMPNGQSMGKLGRQLMLKF